jgi:hypothetical protein
MALLAAIALALCAAPARAAAGASAADLARPLVQSAPPPEDPLPLATQAGCPCLRNWQDARGGVHNGCANPNNDPQVGQGGGVWGGGGGEARG